MGGSGYPDDPAVQGMIKEIRAKAKGAKPNDVVFLNQGEPPFLILDGRYVADARALAGDGNSEILVRLNVILTPEQRERLRKCKKIQVEVFD